MYIWIIIGLIIIIGIYVMTTYNGLVRLRNTVAEAFSTMDVYMKKRYDLIPNLVETVKGYATHERETLEKVISARNIAMNAQTIQQKEQSENMLSGTLKSLFALSENYPNLKADTQFLDLQKQLQKVEEDIAQSRKYYNAIVKSFNTKIESFPSNIIASMFGFIKSSFFTINETERENVKVQF